MNKFTPEIALRPAEAADIEAIAEVVNAHSQERLGTKRVLIDPRGRLRFARYVPFNAEKVVATTAAGRVIAFAYLAHEPPYIASELGIEVHPDYHQAELEPRLLAWAEERARQILSLSPPEAKVVLQCNCFATDQQTQAWLAQAGYHRVREWIHLDIEMAEAPPSPVWPEGVRVRLMDQSRDWPVVGAALLEAFIDHWGYIQPLETGPEEEGDSPPLDTTEEDDPYFNSRAFCFVALYGDEVIGSCLGNQKTVEWPGSGKIGSLSIRRPYRGQGIAKALILHSLGAFYRHGIRRVITDTDGNSFTGANYLYQAVGMKIFRRERLYEKALRDGRELRALTPQAIL